MSNTKRIMEQAQAFASAWSLVGGVFDGGDGMERAEEEKAQLQRMVEELETALNAIPSSDNTIDDLSQYVEKLEAALGQQEPVFWYRPRSDGFGYDGPIHDSQIEPVRRTSGAWVPLYAGPSPSQSADTLVGLRGCNSLHGGAREPDPCIYRMRTTDPGCTGCAERDEDQAAEAGG